MRSILTSGCVWAGMLLSFAAYGQEAAEVPLGALPMQYNASFAGETGGPRINTAFALSAGNRYSNEHRWYASYDQFIPKFRSGIGVTAGYGLWGTPRTDGGFSASSRSYFLALAVAPKFSMKGKVTLSPSLDIAFGLGRSSFSFNSYGYSSRQQKAEGNTLRSRVGLLLNTNKFYVGYSVHLVDYFNTHVENDTANYRVSGRQERFTSYLQLGYTFRRSAESKFSFTPQLALRVGTNPNHEYYGGFRRLLALESILLNFQYKKVIWGLNNTGVHVGWQTEKLRVMLSNGLGFIGREDSGYSGNIVVRYVFKKAD